MSNSLTYRVTLCACSLGYVTQAISINFSPLLFVAFQKEFNVSLENLGVLVMVSFVIQMTVDLLSSRYGDVLGYRMGAVAAHMFTVAGLISLSVLPYLLPTPYIGLLIGTVLMSIGGGLIEVLISPIVDALPVEEKAGTMSLMHSFFCWGSLAVALLSTAFFAVCGTQNWRFLSLLWALLPLLTAGLFACVPIPAPKSEAGGNKAVLHRLFSTPAFWLMLLLMLCAGATEIAASQWSSLFAEEGLGVPKVLGDLLGPSLFALLMGLSRVLFSNSRRTHDLHRLLGLCGLGCFLGYLLIILSPWPMLSLAGFGVCGFSVGLMWPGVLSLGASAFPTGGTAMFSLLAMFGDIGCSIGPGMVGIISTPLQRGGLSVLSALKCGLAVTAVFPLLIFVGVFLLRRIGHSHQFE